MRALTTLQFLLHQEEAPAGYENEEGGNGAENLVRGRENTPRSLCARDTAPTTRLLKPASPRHAKRKARRVVLVLKQRCTHQVQKESKKRPANAACDVPEAETAVEDEQQGHRKKAKKVCFILNFLAGSTTRGLKQQTALRRFVLPYSPGINC